MTVTSPTQFDEAAYDASIEAAFDKACATITPTWPLDQAVAVNPHWHRIGAPLRQVAAKLAVLGRVRVLPSRPYLLNQWQIGRIQPIDLQQALAQLPSEERNTLTEQACIDVLHQRLRVPTLPLLMDLLDDPKQHHRRLSWRQSITFQISQTCAAYFDHHQAHWQPERPQGLYAFWYDTLTNDRGVGVMTELKGFSQALKQLPRDRYQAKHWAFRQLELPGDVWPNYLEALLLNINGWASWCAYVGQEQGNDNALRELLTIRLAWGALLLECRRADPTQQQALAQAFTELQTSWHEAEQRFKHTEQLFLIDEVWQSALEIGFQRHLLQALQQPAAAPTAQPSVQALFCIDVRSEPMRRAIESLAPDIETRAFAGFFGVPASYSPFASDLTRPQLPGLAKPQLAIGEQLILPHSTIAGDTATKTLAAKRQTHLLARLQAWSAIHWPSTTFSFVEAVGLGYLPHIWHWLKAPGQPKVNDDHTGLHAHQAAMLRPQLVNLTLDDKVKLAASTLRNMGIDQHMARLVLLIGHGSQSANNAHASTLDCGACGGQTGEANARALAFLLNEPEVRKGLVAHGINVPANTIFMAALHNTSTDQIQGFDSDLLPDQAQTQWQQVSNVFKQAGAKVRHERADSLWLQQGQDDKTLQHQFCQRANDGAQTRPEWGLTGNAAFVIGPRHYTQKYSLNRCYLHDYDANQDPNGEVLSNLMMGPMLVTHWISWQYHASACDPLHYGSGNKVLHNVVGGHLGVFEGNGGDLRIGLPMQSLFDGEVWRHEPLRLTVAIVAPPERIASIIDRQPLLQQLVNHGWLLLWAVHNNQISRYAQGAWLPISR